MISKDIAKKQTLRLGQMFGFPKDNPVALNELVLAVEAATTEAMARAAVDSFLETATADTRCPMPAQLRVWLYERQEAEMSESKRRMMDCSYCFGTGQEIVERGGLTGAKTCRCRLAAVSTYPD